MAREKEFESGVRYYTRAKEKSLSAFQKIERYANGAPIAGMRILSRDGNA